MHGELRALGIDHLFDYRTEDFEALARQIAGGRGVSHPRHHRRGFTAAAHHLIQDRKNIGNLLLPP